MCGLFFSIGFEHLPDLVIDSVVHRGPDGRGWNNFSSSMGPIVMAHRRLAIIDLSEDGHQPMSADNQRYWVTYNGEIYNYLEIRAELEKLGHQFKTKTDTEVLLASYLEWGADCLNHFNGMFAFVIWDDKDKKLFAARDRFGVKPLYYYKQGDKIAFASEIKQFTHIPVFEARLNKEHLHFFLSHKYHPISDSTLFMAVKHVEPGHYIISDDSVQKYKVKYWYTPHVRALKNTSYSEKFLKLFQEAISRRLIADVPVGALLSGGLDSSSIVCVIADLMKNSSNCQGIETFTSWSSHPTVDEKEYSDAVIAKTGFLNHLVEIKDDSLQNDIENIIYHQEEPFISTSIQSEWNIYKAISSKTQLKVVLDGQGSDELTCGYLFMIPQLLSYYMKNGAMLTAATEFFYTLRKHKDLSVKTLALDSLLKTYPRFISCIQQMRGKGDSLNDQENFNTFQDYTRYLLRRSIEPQLRWQDRSSMAFSIESRQPFLDYQLVEFLLSLPLEEKFNQGMTKIILRKSMKDILPEKVRNRVTKFGFPSPQKILMDTLDSSYFKKYVNRGSDFLVSCQLDNYRESIDLFLIFSLGVWVDKFQVNQ